MDTSAESAKTLTDLHSKFREIRHDINNSLAVIMALSELGERNPANYEKLGKTVLTRCPDIVHRLQSFGDELGALAKELEPAPVE
jgi:hypothetical protein